MRMDEKSRQMRRMLEGMRAMTEAEMKERQNQAAAGMRNAGMRQVQGMENMWATNEGHWIPDKPKPTFWKRLKLWFHGA